MIYVRYSWKNHDILWILSGYAVLLSVYYTVSYSNGMLSTISLDNADGTTFGGRMHLRYDVDSPNKYFLMIFF